MTCHIDAFTITADSRRSNERKVVILIVSLSMVSSGRKRLLCPQLTRKRPLMPVFQRWKNGITVAFSLQEHFLPARWNPRLLSIGMVMRA